MFWDFSEDFFQINFKLVDGQKQIKVTIPPESCVHCLRIYLSILSNIHTNYMNYRLLEESCMNLDLIGSSSNDIGSYLL